MQIDDSDAVREVVATLRRLCAKLPAAEEYVMVHHPAFRVGKKPFAIVGMREEGGRGTLSINLGPEMQEQLLDDGRFERTPYIGQHGWVTIARDALEVPELEALVVGSYRRVAGKRQLAELDGGSAKPPSARGGVAPAKRRAPAKRAAPKRKSARR